MSAAEAVGRSRRLAEARNGRVRRIAERSVEATDTDHVLNASEGVLQAHRIAQMLAASEITDAQRRALESMKAGTGLSLSRYGREKLVRIERYVEMVRTGRLPERGTAKDDASLEAWRRRASLSFAAQRERVNANPRPAWMSDPSLLPKRPPGAR